MNAYGAISSRLKKGMSPVQPSAKTSTSFKPALTSHFIAEILLDLDQFYSVYQRNIVT